MDKENLICQLKTTYPQLSLREMGKLLKINYETIRLILKKNHIPAQDKWYLIEAHEWVEKEAKDEHDKD